MQGIGECPQALARLDGGTRVQESRSGGLWLLLSLLPGVGRMLSSTLMGHRGGSILVFSHEQKGAEITEC